jgi:CubicO group peptidase (beta-lactamase class C family)
LTGGLAGLLSLGLRPRLAYADPIGGIQNRINNFCRNTLDDFGANVGVIVGIVTPDNAERGGQFLTAGQDTFTNPFGKRLDLNEHTLFEIGSISKVFTSGIHYMRHGNYDGTLGSHLRGRVRLSEAVAAISLKDIAIYRSGFAQDNQGGVYPGRILTNLETLFGFMADFAPPYTPGSCYAYSNMGWSLFGMAAVGLDGTDTERYLRDYDVQLRRYCGAFDAPQTRLFEPGMKPHLPKGFGRVDFAALPPHNLYYPTAQPWFASGGIVSTGADMMRFLRYSMGQLPGGLTDPGLALQQTETFQVSPCSNADVPGPVTSYGWFHNKFKTPEGEVIVLNKDGGVPGFTSWMGFTRWQGSGAPASHGLFVLSNSHGADALGIDAMRMLLNEQQQRS